MFVSPYRPVAIFLRQDYLVTGLTGAERLRCHQRHVEVLCERISPFSLPRVYGPGLTLFAQTEGDLALACVLRVEQKSSMQSELALTLSLNEAEIYRLGFALVPGAPFGEPDETIALVSLMQGLASSFDDIRAATKLMSDVAPQAVLFAVLLGLAETFGLRRIVGVPERRHPSRKPETVERLRRAYDEFFAAAGALPNGEGYFVYDRDRFGDILDNMPAKHRARTKTKRRLKARIAAETGAALAPHAMAPAAWGERLWHFPATQLGTRVGARTPEGVATQGAAGCLLYGPYVDLRPGRYAAEFLFSGAASGAVVEATAEKAREILARAEVGAAERVVLDFALVNPREDVEFRVFVQASAAFLARGVSLRFRLDAPAC